jgi:flavorubredoxin
MSSQLLFSSPGHRNVLLPDFGDGEAVQANQHLIIDGAEAMLLDPGGHQLFARLVAQSLVELGDAKLTRIFLSHQDPDVVAAINGWLMTTEATAHLSERWIRFLPHFGLDRLMQTRLLPIADQGGLLRLGDAELHLIPAHFLHSPGNFQVYDPVSKLLYTGDLGASLGAPYAEVQDFDAHVPYMEPFHRRYMAGNAAMRAWAERIEGLEIDGIAPQHGAIFRGPSLVRRFIDWCTSLRCGLDDLRPLYGLP